MRVMEEDRLLRRLLTAPQNRIKNNIFTTKLETLTLERDKGEDPVESLESRVGIKTENDLPRTAARVRIWKASGSSPAGSSTKTMYTAMSSFSSFFVFEADREERERKRKRKTRAKAMGKSVGFAMDDASNLR